MNTRRRLIAISTVQSDARLTGLYKSPGSIVRHCLILGLYESEEKNGIEENLLPEVHTLGYVERRYYDETKCDSQEDAEFVLKITSLDGYCGWLRLASPRFVDIEFRRKT